VRVQADHLHSRYNRQLLAEVAENRRIIHSPHVPATAGFLPQDAHVRTLVDAIHLNES